MKHRFTAVLFFIIALLVTSFGAQAQTGVVQSVLNVSNKAATYAAAADRFTLASSPTDVFTISGSATKTIYIKAITLSGIATTSGTIPFRIAKRSTAGTYLAASGLIAGVANAVTNVPLDSLNAAATATSLYFTGNMTTVGTLIGYIDSRYIEMNAALNTASNPSVRYEFGHQLSSYIPLRSAAETIAVNMVGTTVAGGTLSVSVEWIER